MNTNDLDVTLVVGGTGKTGRRVAERLRSRGLSVRVASRAGSPAFDWYDARTWEAALAGVRVVYLAYAPDLAVPDAAAHVRAFSAAAVASGVRRIVLLSGRGAPRVEPAERAVKESGAAWTILRAAWFAQNFSEGHLLEPVRAGELAFPAGDVAEPFVDVDDVADVALASLTEEGHVGQTYDLTGPRLLTFADASAEIARASGRPLRYVPVTPAEYSASLAAVMPREDAAFLGDLFGSLLDGHNAHLTDGVARVLGRPARDFADYARGAAGAWRAPPR